MCLHSVSLGASAAGRCGHSREWSPESPSVQWTQGAEHLPMLTGTLSCIFLGQGEVWVVAEEQFAIVGKVLQ